MPASEFQRRSTDRGEPTNADLRELFEGEFSRLDKKVDELDKKLDTHIIEATDREARVKALAATASEVAVLHDFRVKVEVIAALVSRVQWLSLIAALFGLLGFAVSVLHVLETGVVH